MSPGDKVTEVGGPDQKKEQKVTTSAYHGTEGNAILGIIDAGKMNPAAGEIFLARIDFARGFMHGVDSQRKASFVIEVELSFDQNQVEQEHRRTPGVPLTKILKTADPVDAKVIKLHVRRKLSEEEQEEYGKQFQFAHISGELEIKDALKNWDSYVEKLKKELEKEA